MAAQAVGEADRALQVDRCSRGQRAQARAVEGLPHHVRGEGPVHDLGDGQAHAVDGDRLPEEGVLGGAPDGQARRVTAVLDSGHLAEFFHDSGEHPRFPPRSPTCRLAPGVARAHAYALLAAGLPAACVLPPIRTFTVGPGISPGQPTAGCGRVADFDRRLGVSPTPEHAYSYS